MKPIFLILALLLANPLISQGEIQTKNEIIKLEKSKSKLWYLEGEADGKVLYNSAKLIYIGVALLIQPWMHIYDKKGNLISEWRIPQKEIKKLGYKYKGHQFDNNAKGYFVIKKKKSKSKSKTVYFFQGDLNGNITGKAIRIGTTNKNGYVDLLIDRIEGDKMSVLSKTFVDGDKTMLFSISTLKEGAKKPTYSERFNIKWEANDTEFQFYSSNDSTHYIVVRNFEKVEVEKKRDKKVLITKLYAISGKEITQIDINPGEDLAVSDLSIGKDESGRVTFIGHLSKVSKSSFSGLIFGKIKDEDLKLEDKKFVEFDKDLLEKLNKISHAKKSKKDDQENKEPKKIENRHYKLIDVYPTSDGGGILISQQNWIKVYVTRDNNGNVSYNYYHYYGNIAVMKVNKEGALEWSKILNSFQVYVNYDPGNPYTSVHQDEDLLLVYDGSQKALDILKEDEEAKLSPRDSRSDAIFCLKITPNGTVTLGRIYDYKTSIKLKPSVTDTGIIGNTLYIPMKKKKGMLGMLAKKMLKIEFK